MDTLKDYGGPVVWVSHDRDEVYRRCPQVCVMDRGRTMPVEDMKQMFACPETVTAARLSGCKNYTPMENAGGTKVFLPEWNLTLDCGRPIPAGAGVLGVRSHFIGPQFPENRFACQVEQVVENVFSMVILVRPVGADQKVPAIRLEMEKELWQQYGGEGELRIGIHPKDLLLLREEEL